MSYSRVFKYIALYLWTNKLLLRSLGPTAVCLSVCCQSCRLQSVTAGVCSSDARWRGQCPGTHPQGSVPLQHGVYRLRLRHGEYQLRLRHGLYQPQLRHGACQSLCSSDARWRGQCPDTHLQHQPATGQCQHFKLCGSVHSYS